MQKVVMVVTLAFAMVACGNLEKNNGLSSSPIGVNVEDSDVYVFKIPKRSNPYGPFSTKFYIRQSISQYTMYELNWGCDESQYRHLWKKGQFRFQNSLFKCVKNSSTGYYDYLVMVHCSDMGFSLQKGQIVRAAAAKVVSNNDYCRVFQGARILGIGSYPSGFGSYNITQGIADGTFPLIENGDLVHH